MRLSLDRFSFPTPLRAIADGSSGTLGPGVVGAYELRQGAVELDRMANLSAGVLLGRQASSGGRPQALSPAQVRQILDGAETVIDAADVPTAEALTPSASVSVLRTQGREIPGDGGGASYVRVSSDPGHLASFQTADGQWWEMAEPYVFPQVFGPAADGSGDDTPWLDAAMNWQKTRKLGILLSGEYRVGATLTIPAKASIEGIGTRTTRILLTSASAKVEMGGGPNAIAGNGADLVGFEIDGADVANYGFVLSEDERPDSSALGWSVFTGGGSYSRLDITNCRKVGLHVGADSDNSQFHLIVSHGHRAAGTEADSVRCEAPAHFSQCTFGGSTGYAFRADRDVSGSQTPETLYTVESSRLNFSRKGLVYHNGISDSGGAGGTGVFDKCFFENCGFAGSAYPDKEPVVEATLEPAAIHCARGRLNISNPKKLQSGWARSLLKATDRGTIDLTLAGCEASGNSVPETRACTMLVAGLALDHKARISLHGQVELKDKDGFAEMARVAPTSEGYPVHSVGGDLAWEADLSDTSPWSSPGATIGTATLPGRVLAQGVSLSIEGNGSSVNNRIERTLRLPNASKRVILLQVAGLGKKTGSQNRLGFFARLQGAGLLATTATGDEIVWHEDVGGNNGGYDRWVYHCAMAYVQNGDDDVTVQIYSGRGAASPSSDTVFVGQARLYIL